MAPMPLDSYRLSKPDLKKAHLKRIWVCNYN